MWLNVDAGKLQLLDVLMKQLISDRRRVVILSHMSHMLDLLEAYLDACMLLYVRIDCSTKVSFITTRIILKL